MPARVDRMSRRSIWDHATLRKEFDRLSISAVHIRTIYRYILRHGIHDLSLGSLESIPDLPKKAIDLLHNHYTFLTSKIVDKKEASDKSTTKFVIELFDGKRIETVVMRYGDVDLRSFPEQERLKQPTSDFSSHLKKYKSNRRATVCVSSQVGCAMGCKFCATGTMGKLDSLTTGEILEQLYHATQIEMIRNVVFMGQGEPLDNYESIVNAIHGMADPSMFGLSASRISVSTVGIVPRIYQMVQDIPNVSLALSLHAPTQEMRTDIVPTAKAYHVDKIMEAADAFVEHQNRLVEEDEHRRIARERRSEKLRRRHLQSQKDKGLIDENIPPSFNLPTSSKNHEKNDDASTISGKQTTLRRHLMVEYALLGSHLNSTPETAHLLGAFLSVSESRRLHSILNIIPYNPTSAGERFQYTPPSQDVINGFVKIVRSYGVTVLVRQELGQDVNAACGQLVVQHHKNESARGGKEIDGSGDIEDLMVSPTPNSKSLMGSGTLTEKKVNRPRMKMEIEPVGSPYKHMLRLVAVLALAIMVRAALRYYFSKK